MTTITEPKVGDIYEGCLIDIFENYALVSLCGHYVGRLRYKQSTWFRVKNTLPKEFLVGSRIKVIVQQVHHSKTNGNILINLGHRELLPNPWNIVESKFPIGTCVEGKIVEILEYGAIVELEGGYTGLLHNSELSWTDKDAVISQNFSIDENISVIVKNSNNVQHSLLLSHKETKPDPISELSIGAQTTGKIINILPYGIFIELTNRCISLLHHTNIPDNFEGCLNDVLDVEISAIDLSTRRISLSLLKK